jgi:hypothetical protein
MNTVFKVHDKVIVANEESANANRMVQLVAYVQPGNTVHHFDGYFTAGIEGGWIVTAEDLVRKTNFRGEIISDFALVKPSDIRALGAEELAFLPKPKVNNRYMAAA